MTKAVEASLGQTKYHFRLPWFAQMQSDGSMRINGDSQAIMEQEIIFASAGWDGLRRGGFEENCPSVSLASCSRINSSGRLATVWLTEHRSNWRIEVQSPPPGTKGFSPVRIRWVVERSNARHGRCRRNSKDDERRPDSSEAMIKSAGTR